MNVESKNRIQTLLDKEATIETWMIVLTSVAPFFLCIVSFSICLRGGSIEDILAIYTPCAVITSVAALAAAVTAVMLSIKKRKIAEEYRVVSLARVIVDAVFACLAILLPLGSMHYLVISSFRDHLNGMPGHSAGAELIVPGFLFILLLIPALILQMLTNSRMNRGLQSIAADEPNNEN